MKIVGTTLAVCSAAAFMGGSKSNNVSGKAMKTMKKSVEKMADVADTIAMLF